MKSDLGKYKLWYDGYIEVDPEHILKYVSYQNLCVGNLTDDIIEYNRYADNKILVKQSLNIMDLGWNIPEKYLNIDIDGCIRDKLLDNCLDSTDEQILQRIARVKRELNIFKQLNLYDLLRTMVYIIDRFTEENIVWGVGRGSSVSSYVLYLIGVHDIDSIEYELDFNDFLEI
jgi:DNA polymerase III alpha subunit